MTVVDCNTLFRTQRLPWVRQTTNRSSFPGLRQRPRRHGRLSAESARRSAALRDVLSRPSRPGCARWKYGRTARLATFSRCFRIRSTATASRSSTTAGTPTAISCCWNRPRDSGSRRCRRIGRVSGTAARTATGVSERLFDAAADARTCSTRTSRRSISTSRSIDDQVATDFACQFYQGLAGGATIRTAYNEAEAVGRKRPKEATREALYFGQPRTIRKASRRRTAGPGICTCVKAPRRADQWNLPEAVNDPLFGLPPLPEQDLPESPYRHLNWFTRKDAEVFFGRGHQIRELYDRLTLPAPAPIICSTASRAWANRPSWMPG